MHFGVSSTSFINNFRFREGSEAHAMEDEEASDGSEPDDERWFPYVLNGREQHVRQAHVQDQVKNDEHMVPHLHLVLGKRALTIPPAIEETNDAPRFYLPTSQTAHKEGRWMTAWHPPWTRFC